jgi:hypothetical protein
VLLYVHLCRLAFVQYTQQFRSVKVQHNAAKAASSSVPNCFYGGVGAAKNTVWLTDSFFLIFGRGHIQLTPVPPLAPAPPRLVALRPPHNEVAHAES